MGNRLGQIVRDDCGSFQMFVEIVFFACVVQVKIYMSSLEKSTFDLFRLFCIFLLIVGIHVLKNIGFPQGMQAGKGQKGRLGFVPSELTGMLGSPEIAMAVPWLCLGPCHGSTITAAGQP